MLVGGEAVLLLDLLGRETSVLLALVGRELCAVFLSLVVTAAVGSLVRGFAILFRGMSLPSSSLEGSLALGPLVISLSPLLTAVVVFLSVNRRSQLLSGDRDCLFLCVLGPAAAFRLPLLPVGLLVAARAGLPSLFFSFSPSLWLSPLLRALLWVLEVDRRVLGLPRLRVPDFVFKLLAPKLSVAVTVSCVGMESGMEVGEGCEE